MALGFLYFQMTAEINHEKYCIKFTSLYTET